VAGACAVSLLCGGAIVALARASARGEGLQRGDLVVAVRSGQREMRITNLTDRSWEACAVTIEGGETSRPFALPPHATTRVAFDAFDASGVRGESEAPFARAFRSTAVGCRDAAGQWRDAIVR
jgi:hypothetical protein